MHVCGVFTQRTQISPFTLDVTTNRYFIVQRGTPNIYIYIYRYIHILKKITTIVLSHPPHTHDRYNSPTVQYDVRGHYSFLSRSWTLFIPFTSVDTIHSFHFLFSLGDRSLNPITSLRTWVSTPPVVSTRLIPSGRAYLGMPAHHACSTYLLSLHPRFNLWSRLLPISFHVALLINSCLINLSVGQSFIHFISPSLISNYPYQYPKSQSRTSSIPSV